MLEEERADIVGRSRFLRKLAYPSFFGKLCCSRVLFVVANNL